MAEENLYHVERIVGKKDINGHLFYKVKWLGWPSSTNTWEPLQNLQKALVFVQEYQWKQRRKTKKRLKQSETLKRQLHLCSKPRTARIHHQPKQSKKLIIYLKSSQKMGTHWAFGSRLLRIVKRKKDRRYSVEWDDGKQTLVSEEEIRRREPKLLEKFEESKLRLN